jgi:hypothetical protein
MYTYVPAVTGEQWTAPESGSVSSNCGAEDSDFTLHWSYSHPIWQQVSGPRVSPPLRNMILTAIPYNVPKGSVTPLAYEVTAIVGGDQVAHLNPGEQASITFSVPIFTLYAGSYLWDGRALGAHGPPEPQKDDIWMLWVPGYVPGYNPGGITRAVYSFFNFFTFRPVRYFSSPLAFTAISGDVAPKAHVVTWHMTPAEYLKACGTAMPAAPGGPHVTAALVQPVSPPSTGSATAPAPPGPAPTPPTPGVSAVPLAPIFPPAPGSGPGSAPLPQPPSAMVTIKPSAFGGPVDYYTVTSHPDNKTCVAAGGAQPQSCVVTGLRNGTRYYFTAVATNGGGSTRSYRSNPVTTQP